MTDALVTIVTPSLNQGAYIEQTLKSVNRQSQPGIEHIVVDGGSTDDTAEILRKFDSEYRFKWISEPDRGQADAINKGFRKSSGRILGWLNSDDVFIRDDAVEIIVTYFERFPEADIVSGLGVMLDADGNWIRPIRNKSWQLSRDRLRYQDPVLQPATFWRREVWERHSLNRNLHFTFDWDFFYRASADSNILPIADRIVGYRTHGENKTARNPPARSREICQQIRRNVGWWSWQFLLLSSLRGIQALARFLPQTLAGLWRRGIQIVSRFVSRRSGGRMQGL